MVSHRFSIVSNVLLCDVCGLTVNPQRVDLSSLGECRPPSLQTVVASERMVHEAHPQPPRQVAIIIAGRNHAKYLAQSIESALSQTVPCDVIYSDDGSSDGSLQVASHYAELGLIIVSSPTQQGPCAARNRGALATQASLLCWLDSDDVMPPDFVEKHLAAWSPGVPFVYGPAQTFDHGATKLWTVPEWDAYDEWKCNTVNTSALYDRSTWEQAGRWQGDVSTMWDWDLSLRAARIGRQKPRPSSAVLQYRHHPESWSLEINESNQGCQWREQIRRKVARLTVAVVFSGRLPELLPRWFEKLAASVYFAHLQQPVDFVVLLHNKALGLRDELQRCLQRHAGTFATWRIETWQRSLEWSDEMSRRDAVASFMADSCQALRDRASGDLIWFVEDDILVRKDTCHKLFVAATSGDCPPQAVAAPYRNRHVPTQYVGGHYAGGQWQELTTLPDTDRIQVDIAGTGCLMTWRERVGIPTAWKSHEESVAAHDWWYCREIQRLGGTVVMLPQASVGHAATVDKVLT